jgi:hypothetical protein
MRWHGVEKGRAYTGGHGSHETAAAVFLVSLVSRLVVVSVIMSYFYVYTPSKMPFFAKGNASVGKTA